MVDLLADAALVAFWGFALYGAWDMWLTFCRWLFRD